VNLALWQARFAEYLDQRRYARRTVEEYLRELHHFFAFLDADGVQSPADITRERVEGYRAWLSARRRRGRPLGASTQLHRLNYVKGFLRFLARERFLPLDPGADVEGPRVGYAPPRTLLSESEVERLLDVAAGEDALDVRDRAILEVFYGTAIRNEELCALLVEDVDLGRGELRVRCGKGSKARLLPLGEAAVDWLRRYLTEARPQLAQDPEQRLLFVTLRGRRLLRGKLALMVRTRARQAGLRKVVTPHVLRGCCATHMLRHGAGLRHLQELLGHASPEATQRYTRIEVSDLRRVLRRCHPRERGERA